MSAARRCFFVGVLLALWVAGCGSADAAGVDDDASVADVVADPAPDPAADPATEAPPDPGADPAADPAVEAVEEVATDVAAEADDVVSDASTDTFPTIQCGVAYPLFPWFDRKCLAATDCAVVFHQINCCGTRVAQGINALGVDAFASAEAVCDSQYPACGCAESPTTADDGNWGFGPDAFGVSCRNGDCYTFVLQAGPPWSGIACGDGKRPCMPGDEVCCVTAPSGDRQCLKASTPCGAANFAATCDGPEDCGPDGACCDPSGVDTGNFCSTGSGCLALELTVCHADADCGAGNACCPTTLKGWAHGACQPGTPCH